MKNKTLVPERICSLDTTMSLEKILQAQAEGASLVGKVTMWNAQANRLEVDLGNNFCGYISANHISIYPEFDSEQRPSASIRALIGYPVIVNVIDVDLSNDTPCISLSRKENMINAFNVISDSVGEIIDCCITAITSFGVYVDAGNGISGLIHHSQLTTPRLNNLSEIGINVGDKITARILEVNENFQVSLNYKSQFENLAYKLNSGDLIEARILKRVNDYGFFAYLNPNTSSIIDVPIDLPYGTKVVALAKKQSSIHPERLRLSFVAIIE